MDLGPESNYVLHESVEKWVLGNSQNAEEASIKEEILSGYVEHWIRALVSS